MDDKKYLREQIDHCRRKLNTAKLLDCWVLFAAAGGGVAVCCEIVSLIWPFYHVWLAVALCFAAGILTGSLYAVCRRASMRQAAMRLDAFGLKERMVTACELMEQDTELAVLQREDACAYYRQSRDRIRIPLLPDRRHILVLSLVLAAVLGMSLIPSSVRDRAVLQHQVQEQAEEERQELGDLLDALEEVDMESLTQEQRQQLQELVDTMQRSMEELAAANSWESLDAATQRLDYKYGQAQSSLEQLAAQMTDPAAVGLASAQELARAANQNNYQTAAGTPSAASPRDDQNSGNQSSNSQNSGSQGNGNQNSSGQNNGGAENGGQGEGSISVGSGSDDGDGSGDGGNSFGSGEDGQSGGGNGRGTGSSNAVHDYVSIPNAMGEDASLTGNKVGDQDSEYFRQQNGLAWEGEHVDYNSVIGAYTDNAYEGIAGGRYPSGMEALIRDYFESLNK
ncbi:MAG: hypothetical protein NC543_09455 [bacterium]|nr:hypothetical protein [bacterium]MCM1375675.1 hypothetical protein [Muribaculum sp.]